MNTAHLSPTAWKSENRLIRYRDGRSEEGRADSVEPAFLDAETPAVTPSACSDCRRAPGRFYARAQAARCVAVAGP
jgi:hypothetical protein